MLTTEATDRARIQAELDASGLEPGSAAYRELVRRLQGEALHDRVLWAVLCKACPEAVSGLEAARQQRV